MTDEEIYTEADKRYPRRWSGDVENSNNSDKFIEGAEWARQAMLDETFRWLIKHNGDMAVAEQYFLEVKGV